MLDGLVHSLEKCISPETCAVNDVNTSKHGGNCVVRAVMLRNFSFC